MKFQDVVLFKASRASRSPSSDYFCLWFVRPSRFFCLFFASLVCWSLFAFVIYSKVFQPHSATFWSFLSVHLQWMKKSIYNSCALLKLLRLLMFCLVINLWSTDKFASKCIIVHELVFEKSVTFCDMNKAYVRICTINFKPK